MSVLLTLCVVLLPLVTPGRGARRWEPCTGKGVSRWEPAGGLLHPQRHFRTPFRVPGARGMGRGAEDESSREAITMEVRCFHCGQGADPFKEPARRPPSRVGTCLASGEGRTPASAMKPAEEPGLHSARPGTGCPPGAGKVGAAPNTPSRLASGV